MGIVHGQSVLPDTVSSKNARQHGENNSMLKTLAAATILVLSLSAGVATAATLQAKATLQADKPGPQISRNLYGQFSEHLGGGIYDGIWVGEDSRHSQRPRHSQRRGRSPEGHQDADGALARRMFRRRLPLARRHRPARPAPRTQEQLVGRCGRDQCFRHPRVHGSRANRSAPRPMSRSTSAPAPRPTCANGSST